MNNKITQENEERIEEARIELSKVFDELQEIHFEIKDITWRLEIVNLLYDEYLEKFHDLENRFLDVHFKVYGRPIKKKKELEDLK